MGTRHDHIVLCQLNALLNPRRRNASGDRVTDDGLIAATGGYRALPSTNPYVFIVFRPRKLRRFGSFCKTSPMYSFFTQKTSSNCTGDPKIYTQLVRDNATRLIFDMFIFLILRHYTAHFTHTFHFQIMYTFFLIYSSITTVLFLNKQSFKPLGSNVSGKGKEPHSTLNLNNLLLMRSLICLTNKCDFFLSKLRNFIL